MLQTVSARQHLREAFVPLAVMFLISRLVLLAIAATTMQLAGVHGEAASVAHVLCRWDCKWYLDIAANGYSPLETGGIPGESNFGFYPLFPLLLRLFMPFNGGDALHAGIFVSNLCFFGALFYVYLYVRELGLDRTVALLTAAILCVFPQSIVFSAPYTEGLCLLLLAAAMYHLRREHYLAAGVAAAMLSAARPNGVLFIVFAVVWIWQRDGLRALLMPWRAPEKFIPVVFAPLGAFLFFGYCLVATGDAFAHSSTQLIGWGWTFAPPWENVPQQLHSGGNFMLGALVSITVALCSLLLLQERLYAEFAFCIVTVVLIWCGQGLVSVFRYWLVLFPVWIGVARVFAARPLGAALLCGTLGMINGVLACAWALGMAISI
ncbi:mannosyltransferase family protein [Dyella acidiphila]|uniref:Glycosyltransferase RgtA/B/C/D-like domain-containing protein n=1 Tax=Dyella acidiphila TaxID=2775866 RepID=A0ABR9G823_9GAMM|nr:mannosyltransferase family protein [Dyella acidiphila]MBE1160214.1 hypothetical protein [Dyella acidiphila]